MEVICIEEKAFFDLFEKVIRAMKQDSELKWNWVSTERAMELLGIKSKSTLQELRNNGQIRYSQPWKRVIHYDIQSINEFLEKNAKETF